MQFWMEKYLVNKFDNNQSVRSHIDKMVYW